MTMLKRFLFLALCGLILSACGQNAESGSQPTDRTPPSQSADADFSPESPAESAAESPVPNPPETKDLPLLYQKIYEEASEEAFRDSAAETPALVQGIVQRLGALGYTALDSENQVDMANPQRLKAFLAALEKAEPAEVTVLIASAYERFTAFHFHTESGKIEAKKEYYQYNNACFEIKNSVSFPIDSWRYTDEGYFIFTGSSPSAEAYVLTMSDEPETAAWRAEPLDPQCRAFNRQYLLPVGYEKNNLFLADWNSRDYGAVDFYDVFDKWYPAVFGQSVPYVMDENPNVGAVYHIPEKEFEDAVALHLSIDTAALRAKTKYLSEAGAYEYRPRGFYELEYSNLPYPEVVSYKENADGTLTLTVNAVYPARETSRAYTHELVVRPGTQGSFQYVSNTVLHTAGDCDMDWHTDRLTEEEWGNAYGEVPLFTEEELATLEAGALAAAEQVSSVFSDTFFTEESASPSFTTQQCQKAVSLLGKLGFVSTSDGLSMENAKQLETFYADYRENREAQVTVFTVNNNGSLDALTFLHRDGGLQTYYIGVSPSANGKPQTTDRRIRNLEKAELTPKGYFIYAYKELPQYAALCQYWRIRPLSEKCRELTEKYLSGLSYVNYDMLVTDWDSRNAESILNPCMYEDFCRIHTGKEPEVKNGQIPAGRYEQIMTHYLPVTSAQVKKHCGYDETTDSYPYEMTLHRQYPPFGEVTDYKENADGTITLSVDCVWIEQGTDCAFVNTIVVRPFSDGSFCYLSNNVMPGVG